jgi:hypothetical protein
MKRVISIILIGVIVAIYLAISQAGLSFAIAQTDQDEYFGVDRQITLRSASGDLTAGETTTAVTNMQVVGEAIVFINITTATLADGDDEVIWPMFIWQTPTTEALKKP